MAIFPKGINQLTGDLKQDVPMLYDYIKYMAAQLEAAERENLRSDPIRTTQLFSRKEENNGT